MGYEKEPTTGMLKNGMKVNYLNEFIQVVTAIFYVPSSTLSQLLLTDGSVLLTQSVRFIHHYLLNNSHRAGSMENALLRMSDRYILKSAFLQAVIAEFCFQRSIDIESSLHRYYTCFDGAEHGKVDVRFLLCTYLCIALADVAFKNPKRLLFRFLEYFWEPKDGGFLHNSVIKIVSIAAVSDKERETTSRKLAMVLKGTEASNPSNRKYVSREMLESSLDIAPGILLNFRDQILSRLPENDRFRLITREEEHSMLAFDKQANKILLRGATQLWIKSQYKTFWAWAEYCETRKRRRKNALWMLCWRGKRYLRHWRMTAHDSALWRKRFVTSSNMYLEKKLIDCFTRWLQFISVQQKIRRSCHAFSDEFKNIKAGLGYLRIVWCKFKARIYFYSWYFEVLFELNYEAACRWRRRQMLKYIFTSLKTNVKNEKSQRKRERMISEQQNWLTQLIDEINTEVVQMKGQNERETQQDLSNVKAEVHTKKRAIERRQAFMMSTEKNLHAMQRQKRKDRITSEMSKLFSSWEEKWKGLSMKRTVECISRTKIWMTSPDSKSVLLKMMKQLERDFYTSPSATDKRRENQINSHTLMCLCILDGNLANVGMIPDEFFQSLYKQYSNDGAILKTSLEDALHSLGITIHKSTWMGLFDSLCTDGPSQKDKVIHLNELRKQLQSSYEFHGIQGSPWKHYVSPAHQIMMFHNVVSDEKILEHDVTKKHLREITKENYLAQQLFNERTKIFHEKQNDWTFILKERAAKSLQRMYRRRKAIEATRFKLSARKYKTCLNGKERVARNLQSCYRRHQALRRTWFRVNLRYERRYQCNTNITDGKYSYFDSYTGTQSSVKPPVISIMWRPWLTSGSNDIDDPIPWIQVQQQGEDKSITNNKIDCQPFWYNQKENRSLPCNVSKPDGYRICLFCMEGLVRKECQDCGGGVGYCVDCFRSSHQFDGADNHQYELIYPEVCEMCHNNDAGFVRRRRAQKHHQKIRSNSQQKSMLCRTCYGRLKASGALTKEDIVEPIS